MLRFWINRRKVWSCYEDCYEDLDIENCCYKSLGIGWEDYCLFVGLYEGEVIEKYVDDDVSVECDFVYNMFNFVYYRYIDYFEEFTYPKCVIIDAEEVRNRLVELKEFWLCSINEKSPDDLQELAVKVDYLIQEKKKMLV